MEVLVGPSFTIDVPSSPPAPAPQTTQANQRLFLTEDEEVGSSFRISGKPEFFAGDLSSESSSSIGTPDDSDNEEEEEVQSGFKGQLGLGSLDSLEETLPIKRGLSSHFDGKSKSFTDLSQVNTLKELQKQESPFNKRRRVLIASKWSRKSSFYTWSNPKSMPLLPVDEDRDDDYDYDYDDDGDDNDEDDGKARKVPSASSSSSSSLAEEKKQEEEQQQQEVQIGHNRIIPESYAAQMRLRLRSFKTRSFSLADLQEHDDEDEAEDDD